MKTLIFTLLQIILVVINFIPINQLHSQPIYLNIVTHNEENSNDTLFNYYMQKRPHIINLINMIVSKGAKINFQSDWKFLRGVLRYDTGSVLLTTNGKNILRWMKEDKLVEVDPHAHETSHNYADVAFLHTLNGVQPSKVIGGFLYDTIINGNNWENMQDSIRGRLYPGYWWKPDILWGAGTRNHVNDPKYYGVWKPHSMSMFFTHDPSKHLILIGGGCGNKIYDTTQIVFLMNRFRDLMRALELNLVPDTGLVTASLFISQGDFSTAMTNKVSQFIDSLAPYVATGKIIWSNLTNTKNLWLTSYSNKPMMIDCSQTVVSIQNNSAKLTDNYELSQNFPNPFNPETKISFSIPKNDFVKLEVFDLLGKRIDILFQGEINAGKYIVNWNANNYAGGVYHYKLTSTDYSVTKKMLLIK